MKTIGLIGGMSWESSAEYYRIINREVQARLGGVHSAQCLMWSMEFGEIKELQYQGRWDLLTGKMMEAAKRLEAGGADFLVICTNTMHKMAEQIEEAVSLPIIHIADPTGSAITAADISSVGLLGTAFTMEQEFYKGRLRSKFGLNVIVPEGDDRQIVHEIIYTELVKGIIRDASRDRYRAVIRRLVDRGAESVILGCTEIMLLISEDDGPVPMFDTTRLHALAAVEMALKD